MKICIVAEHASTKFGGEAILPVHYFRLLRARGIDSWLVVHSRTRSEVEALFPEAIDRILFVPDLWIQKLIFYLSGYLPRRVSESTLGLLNQLITQFCQRAVVRRLVLDRQIDVIHQPIPVAPRFPSAIFSLGAPVVIGPLNGGMEYPPSFRRTEFWMSRAAVVVARLFTGIANTLLPGKKQAEVVLVANERTRRVLPAGVRGRVVELVENGIDFGIWQGANNCAQSTTTRFVFLGRLVDWKALDIVIRALGKLPSARLKSASLEVIGDGPMLEAWQSLADELGLKERVHFVGWLPQRECAVRLRNSVALVLPSVYECGGAVVLEAMALGKPVIATNWGGPADYLDSSCGVLVEPESYWGLVDGFSEAMRKLIDEPGLAESMGAAGRERAAHYFDWQQKIDQMIGIYHSLAEKRKVAQKSNEAVVSSHTVSERN
jgi:glycosyltransferase involved in cell wall biosynthesis